MSQAIKVHIGTTDYAAKFLRLCIGLHLFSILFHPRNRHCTCRFSNRSGIFKNIFHRRTNLIGIDRNHLIHTMLCNAERNLPHLCHCDTIGKNPHLIQNHPLTRLQSGRHTSRIFRLHTNDFGLWRNLFNHRSHTRNQPSSTDSNKNGIQSITLLA